MTQVRNKSLIKQVLIRDFGLCRCCSFKGSEVHHVIPLIYGGEDKTHNMVTLCFTCHIHAPDTKQEFYEYMKRGGARTEILLGRTITYIEENNLSFQILFPWAKQIIKWLREVDLTNARDTYNLKDSLEVEDVDFKENRIKSDTKIKETKLAES